MAFTFTSLEIPDVVVVRPDRYDDDRGYFKEVFRSEVFAAAGLPAAFAQDNVTRSRRGVLRGLHYQLPPVAQGKLIGVVRGRIFDVAVDLRAESPTYGGWVGRTLDDDTGELLWVPAGFAHGYCVLSESADVMYKVSHPFEPSLSRGMAWDDPTVGVEWPISEPVLSQADQRQPTLDQIEAPFPMTS